MTTFLSWLSSSSTPKPTLKQTATPTAADTSKTIAKIEENNDDLSNDWVFFEDLGQNLKQNTATLATLTAATAATLTNTANTNTATRPSAGDTPVAVPVLKVQEQSINDIDGASCDEEDDDDHFVENASVASTIEPVRVSLPHKDLSQQSDPQQSSSNSNLSSILSTSLSSLVQSAAATAAASSKQREPYENLKCQPRTLLTLAQLKDKELKMKKMQKMASLRR